MTVEPYYNSPYYNDLKDPINVAHVPKNVNLQRNLDTMIKNLFQMLYNLSEYEIYHFTDETGDGGQVQRRRLYRVCTLNGEPPLVDLVCDPLTF
jgi:hypothetical protein